MVPLCEDGTFVFGVLLFPTKDPVNDFGHFTSWEELKTTPCTVESFQPVCRTRRRWSEA